MNKPLHLFPFACAFALTTACGAPGDSQMDREAEISVGAPAVELSGQFSMSAAEPFNATAETSELMCQRATPGSPFRATWFDPATGIYIVVTGWPQEGAGNETRVDAFRVFQQLTGEVDQRQARLSGATLSVEELSSSGAASTYAVEASGTFEQGGTFSASGNCLA